MSDQIDILGVVSEVETISVAHSIRELRRLRKMYGQGRWRKCKGKARVRLPDGTTCVAEVHWYEAHGIGRRDMKVKRIISWG